MDNSFIGIISVLVTACGLYCLYAYFMMKKTGEINTTLLLGSNLLPALCKDKDAFLKKTLPMVLLLGVVTTIYGIIDMIHIYVMPLGIIDGIAMVVFLVVLICYGVVTTKCKKQYFNTR